MNHLTRSIMFTLLCCLLLAACASPTPAPLPPASDTPFPATPTSRVPTQTPLPSASPTLQQVNETVTVPDCVENGKGDTVNFNDFLESLWPALNELDSYRYHTLYRYLETDRYADGELSVEVEGTHDGLLASPVESIFPLVSQYYERSKVVYTDLPSGMRSEIIATEDGFWVLGAGDTEWLAFDPATSADFTNLAEMFSPMGVLFMVGGGGSLAPGVRADTPAMMAVDNLDGREVNHRCWILPKYEDSDFNAYLVHWESTYTFLSDAEIHLWTTKDDSQLVRLVLTGKNVAERQGLSEYAEKDDYIKHDPPLDFLLSMEIADVDTPVDIEPPPSNQILSTIPGETKPAADISAPYNDLPLPAGAEKVGVFGGESGEFPLQRMTATPREYRWEDYEIYEGELDSQFGPGWYQVPADRRPAYAAELGIPEAAAFYLDEMSRRGWLLKEKFFQLGWPVLYLFFERDGITLPVVLGARELGATSISAILPPADNVLQTRLSGWTTYTTKNSDLSSDSIQAIAFDTHGRAWIGTENGLSVFDGETWTTENPGERVTGLTIDSQGRVWVGTFGRLSVFDGKAWKTYHSENSKLPDKSITAMVTDKSERVWLGIWESGVSVFDKETITNYSPGQIGLPSGHNVDAIASDPQGRIWIGTSGGGVYMFDGKAWKTVLKAKSPPNTTYFGKNIEDMAIDRNGRVWIGTGEGLSVYNGSDWITYIQQNSGMPFEGIDALAIDEYDRVWVGGAYGAVGMLETDGTWKDFTPVRDAAAGFSTDAVVIHPDGRIWVGTDEGLNIFTPPEPASPAARVLPDPTPLPPPPTPMSTPGLGFTTYTIENSGLVSNEVYAVAIDGQDRVWVGTSEGTSVLSPKGEWTSYQIANSGLLSDKINSLFIDEQDQVWMGTGYGVAVLASDGAWKLYFTPNERISQSVADLLVDGQGRAWIAKDCSDSCDALSVLSPDGKWSTYTTENSDLASDLIHSLALDKQDQVWMTTYDGVSVLAPNGKWTNYTKADLGLTSDDVWVKALSVDEQGRAWIGSYGPWTGSYGNGLIMLAPDGSRAGYTIDNPDPTSNDILALLIDDEGRVWLGTGIGLSVLLPDGSIESYTYEDSELIEGIISSLAMDSLGRLWIGTDAGLGVFVPNSP